MTQKPIKTINKYFKEHVNISEMLSLGKTYKYSIDKSFIKPYINGDRFIFQTPMLYVPYAPKHIDSYNTGGIGFDNWHIDASLYNSENDPDVLEFETWIRGLEYDIYKCLRKRSNLGITIGGKLSNLKNDDYRDCSKLSLKLDKQTNFYILDAQGKIGSRIDYKTELKPPCYAIFIIEIASLWIRKNNTHLDTIEPGINQKSTVTWGINFIVHAAQCLPCHASITPIPELSFLPNNQIKVMATSKQIQGGCVTIQPPPPPPMPMHLKNIPALPSFMDTYLKMVKMGIPKDAVKQKMVMAGHNPELLDNPNPTIIDISVTDITANNILPGPPKITNDMLTGVKLKKSNTNTPNTNDKQVNGKHIKQQMQGFAVNLDELLDIKSRLKKPKQSDLPTYSKIFNPTSV